MFRCQFVDYVGKEIMILDEIEEEVCFKRSRIYLYLSMYVYIHSRKLNALGMVYSEF